MTNKSAGFSMIEVLVTLVILSVGLLGLAALQARALQYNQGAYLRSQANILAYDVVDRMRINRARAHLGDYNIALSSAAPTGSTLAKIDVIGWLDLLAATLPGGDGSVDCDDEACEVRIVWQEADGGQYEFTYQTRI